MISLPLTARVLNGRLTLDEPIDLPEGTELELVPADTGDDLDDADRARLHASIERSLEEYRAGKGISADVALKRLGFDGATR